MIKLVRHRLQVRDDSFRWHVSGRKKMSGNKIYFRGEIVFDDGWGGGEFERERERSKVITHKYLARATACLYVTFTESGEKFWRWGLRARNLF